MSYVIGGLDIGTSGCKIALYDENALHIDTYYKEYPETNEGGRREIDFGDVRASVLSLLSQASAKYKIDALCVTSFGETYALLDEEDKILAPSMLYTDPRGSEECEELCACIGRERLTRMTGARPHAMYSISKLLWQRKHRPDLFSRCRHILLGEDFIVYTLTGVAMMDYSLAARTGAFDIEKKEWIPEVLEAAGILSAQLSRPVPSGTVAGVLRPSLMAELGIQNEITVLCGAHDQVAAMVGAGIFDGTQAMDGTGTVECIPVLFDRIPTDMSFYDCGYSLVPYVDGRYACYAVSYTGGATLKWFRDNFAEQEYALAKRNGQNVYAMLDGAVSDAPTGILVLPHFAGAATPYMDSNSKAVFVGLTLESTKLDLYKALMEGTSYEILLNFNTLKRYKGDVLEIRATGGGAMSDVWLSIKADVLGTPITALNCREVGAAGSVALAGVALGVYESLSETVAKMSPVRRVFHPDPEKRRVYAALYSKYSHLYLAAKQL